MPTLKELASRPDSSYGPVRVSPARRVIEGPGGATQVEPLIMQLLLVLLDAEGRVVTRAELFARGWGNGSAGDDSLNRAIGRARRALAHSAPGLFEIENIPRTGYRLISQVGPTEDGSRKARDLGRRALIVGGAAAAGSLALAAALRQSPVQRTEALVDRAQKAVEYEYSGGRLGESSEAIPLLEQALAIDPGNSRAIGLMAYVRANAAIAGGGDAQIEAAEAALRQALQSGPQDPHAQLAALLFEGDQNWVRTEDRLLDAVRSAPRNTLALGWLVALYQAAGRNRLSWQVNEQAIRIDPIAPTAQYRRALKHWIFGRPNEALGEADRLFRMWPGHSWVWNARFMILAFTGRAPAAADMIADDSSRPTSITPARLAQWRPTLVALDHPTQAAVRIARQANLEAARVSPGQAAYAIMALSGLGEVDAAYDVAEGLLLSKGSVITRAPRDSGNMLVNNSNWRRTQWLSTPPLLGFRSHQRFTGLCDAIGLTEYWDRRGIRPDYPMVPMAKA